MEKLKILFCIESLNCGGAEKSLLNLLDILGDEKYDIHLIMHQLSGDLFHHLPRHIKVHKFGGDISFLNRCLYWLLKKTNYQSLHSAQIFWRLTCKAIPTYNDKYDIAIGWGQGFATYFTADKVLANKKFSWVNVDYEKAGYKANYDKKLYEKFDQIVAVSDFVNYQITNIFNNKVSTVYDVINAPLITKMSNDIQIALPNSHNNIVTVARLAKAKGFNLVIEAAQILKTESIDFHWTIVGEGPERENIKHWISKSRLEKYITLVGFKENPYPYIKAADIYCQPSLFEGLGLTVVEAAIMCKPIVVTNFPTASEILTHKKTGLICDFKAKDIANNIKLLIENPTLKSDLIHELKSKNYSNVATVLEQFENIIGVSK